MDKITAKEWDEFEKDYVVLQLKNPYYRMGQHFINYFGAKRLGLENIYSNQAEDTPMLRLEGAIWNEIDPVRVVDLVDRFRQ